MIRLVCWLFTLIALGCGGGDAPAEEGTAGSEELPAAPTVTGAVARQMVADGAFLLDVTSAPRNEASGLDGATNIPFPELSERMSEVPRDRPVVVYCLGGGASPRAGAMLQAEGYDVHVLGARRNWEDAASTEGGSPADEESEDTGP